MAEMVANSDPPDASASTGLIPPAYSDLRPVHEGVTDEYFAGQEAKVHCVILEKRQEREAERARKLEEASNWTELVDPDTGEKFWFNAMTKESSSTLPEALVPDPKEVNAKVENMKAALQEAAIRDAAQGESSPGRLKLLLQVLKEREAEMAIRASRPRSRK
mmetsp:Transcript_6005/g.11435  ORF Transcript_6005/g.11435 Transcript_6005/m.11435 type:complete len:162 (-) Transcript_6005:72-557(-)